MAETHTLNSVSSREGGRSWPFAGSRGGLAALAFFAVFALNFGAYRVFGDGEQYFSLLERLFGDRGEGSGYNFGVGLMNAPFYAAAKVVEAAGFGTGGHSITAASITIASVFWLLVAGLVTLWLLERLGLPERGLAVGAALLGTPAWYYASFSPSYSHAADAGAFALAAAGVWFLWHQPGTTAVLATGGALGLAVAVRPFNAGVVAGCLLALVAFHRYRDAVLTGAAAVGTFGALATIPLSLGLSLTSRFDGTSVLAGAVGFAPLSPLRMLFSLHRGLFVWTPVTLLALVGLALLLRGHRERPFLVTLASMGAGLLLIQAGLDWWDGGWSFSMRHFAAPVVLYGIGIAGLLAAATPLRLVAAVVVIATAWSVFLGMNHAFGASQEDGADDIAGKVLSGERTPREFADLTWSYSRTRHVVERLP
ncbi:MAG TPA: hypothetical protein VM184_06585 [Gaiellaceae bacterium]|nr:hypothetical protein [Gaiellaceae bacterium]